MKSTKLFILGLFVSLAWIACKNETSASEATEATEEAVEAPFTAVQAELTSNVEALSKGVNQKITELEASLQSTLDEGAKTKINEELAKYKEFQTKLSEVGQKLASATEESWNDIQEEATALHYEVKSAMTTVEANLEKAGQISNQ